MHHMITRAKLRANPNLNPVLVVNTGEVAQTQRSEALVTTNSTSEPKGYKITLKKPQWKEAMDEKMEALMTNDTCSLVHRPDDTNVVGSKWIFKIKYKEDGTIERHKARLVAQGHT